MKMHRMESMIRLQTLYISASMGANVKRPEDLWTLPGDKKSDDLFIWGENEDEAKAMYEKIKQAHGIN